MARIESYPNEPTTEINASDRLIGTDGGSDTGGPGGSTKNFTLGGIRSFIHGNVAANHIPVSDGDSFTESTITFADGNVTINGDIFLDGILRDSDGNAILDGISQSGGVVPGRYNAGVVTSGQMFSSVNTLSQNTVYAITGIPSTDIYLPDPSLLNIDGGEWVKISNLTDGSTPINIDANGTHFMNDLNNTCLTLDNHTASFELVFINSTVGWVIIGAAGDI